MCISSSLSEETQTMHHILIPDLDDRIHYKFYFEQILLHIVDLQLEKGLSSDKNIFMPLEVLFRPLYLGVHDEFMHIGYFK